MAPPHGGTFSGGMHAAASPAHRHGGFGGGEVSRAVAVGMHMGGGEVVAAHRYRLYAPLDAI